MSLRPKSADARTSSRRSQMAFAMGPAVERLNKSPAVSAFVNWTMSREWGWEVVHKLFLSDSLSGTKGAVGLTKAKWVQALRWNGFSDTQYASDVWDDISAENGAISAGEGEEPTISLIQLRRFQVRATESMALLNPGESNSPSTQLISFLRKRRGSVIRAWQVDLDVRSSGKLAQSDFMAACRKLGFAGQAKLMWDSLRGSKPDRASPLEVHELDAEEAENLEDFADALWNSVGFDLSKAWEYLDPNNQQYSFFEDFKAGAEALGYRGNTKLLFKGLDVSGLGRINKEEFGYISKISRLAQRRLGGQQRTFSAVAELIAWVQRDMGGAHALLVKLGLGGTGAKEILVGDLAVRLSALGFEGDALGAASRAARTDGGTTVSAETLYSLMSGTRPLGYQNGVPEQPQGIVIKPRDPQGLAHATFKSPQSGDKAWDNGVNNISMHNGLKSVHTKQYFVPPPRPRSRNATPQRSKRPASSGKSRPQSSSRPVSARGLHHGDTLPFRPAWNHNYGGINQSANEVLPAQARFYFSDPAEKPVRDRQRAVVGSRQAARAQPEWEQPYAAEDNAMY